MENQIDSQQIKWAITALRHNSDAYALASNYYDGNQRLAFATDKFRNTFGRLFRELSINHCALCVDVPADRLQIEGFKVVDSKGGENKEAAKRIVEIWRRNRMNKRAGEVHTEALKTGDSYVIVDWANPDNPAEDRATIYPNQAGRCAVMYDEENPGYIIQAARWWVVKDGTKFVCRLNVYTRDFIYKYQTKQRSNADLPTREGEFAPIDNDWQVPNKYKKVPVFHFANNAEIGSNGKSENKDIIPPQDGLNKAVCDAMVAAEFAALGQRYAIGLELQEDGNGNVVPPFRDGLDKLWVAPPQRDTDGNQLDADKAQPIQFGQFNPANLDQLLSIKAAFRKDISLISGIPAHYFMDTGGVWPSGESLKTAEQRLTNKVRDRQIAFGNVWEDVVRFCLEIEGVSDVQPEADWEDTAPHSEAEDIANAKTKMTDLKMPQETVWGELGYKPTEVEAMKGQQDQEAAAKFTRDSMVTVPTVGRSQ